MGGHHHSIEGVSSRIVTAAPLGADSPAPFYLASNRTFRRAVAAGTPIRMGDLDFPAQSELLHLRREQDRIFFPKRRSA